jgi:hypothetical protein
MNIIIYPRVKPIFTPFHASLFPAGNWIHRSFKVTVLNEETSKKGISDRITGHFSRLDWGVIVILAVLAFVTSSYGLPYILPGGTAPGLVHGFLKLPGPGAGIFISSAFVCLWFVFGLLVTKKHWTAISMAVLIVIFRLLAGLATGSTSRFDFLLIAVAIIIECVGLLPIEKKPWQNIFPPFIGIMGIITLALMLTGNAKMGENGAAATVFPLGYAVTGILAIALAVICWFFPMKYVAGAGLAEMFYIVYCWLFNGKSGFATWVPVPGAIPALLTFALVSGAVMAFLAYCVYILVEAYQGAGPLARFNR